MLFFFSFFYYISIPVQIKEVEINRKEVSDFISQQSEKREKMKIVN